MAPMSIVFAVRLFQINKDNPSQETYLTPGGPMIIPVQRESVMSESSSSPQLMVPSPLPFWPASNSSRRRKLRGTTAEGEGTR